MQTLNHQIFIIKEHQPIFYTQKVQKPKMQIINRFRPKPLPTHLNLYFIHNCFKLPKCIPSVSLEQFPIADLIPSFLLYIKIPYKNSE